MTRIPQLTSGIQVGRDKRILTLSLTPGKHELEDGTTLYSLPSVLFPFNRTTEDTYSSGILVRDLEEARTMFERNLELIENTLQTIANESFDSTPPESLQVLKTLGKSIEKSYQGSISLGKDDNANVSRTELDSAHSELNKLINLSNNSDLERYLKIFYAHFLLTNEAEKANIIAVNAARDEEARITGIPKHESIENAIKTLFESGVPPEEVQKIVDNLSLELVFTAHPTEAKSDIEILLLQEVSKVLRSSSGRESSELIRKTKLLLGNLGPSNNKPTVLDEVDRNLVYFDSIYNVIPRIHDELKSALKKYYPLVRLSNRPIVKYSSWVGGDRDGHPGVTPKVHGETAKRHHNQAIEYHIALLNTLKDSTSNEIEKTSIRAIISKLEIKLQNPEEKSTSYKNPEELIQEITSLKLDNPTSTKIREDLLININTFGLHLAQIDTREHSKKHEEALTHIFSNEKIKSTLKQRIDSYSTSCKSVIEKLTNGTRYEELSKKEKIDFLSELTEKKETINIATILEEIPETELDKNNTSRVIRTFQKVKKIQETFSEESANIQITSFTHDESDVLESVFFAKESGLVTVNDDGSIDSKLDFMPLFETIDDLNKSDKTLADLFKIDAYKKVLKSRGNLQKVFLGYSDGTKDGGYAAAFAALWNAPNKIKSACENADIDSLQWEIFHGRGGSLGRGGGKAGEAISSQSRGTILSRIRITEQGEFLSFRYSDDDMAFRHLEIRLEALIRASANKKPRNKDHEKILLDIGDVSYRHYRKLFEDPRLGKIIENASPFTCVQFSNWGSRPTNRWNPSARLNLEQLRAIPWVVTWNQIRMMIPGWYGTGAAINELINDGKISLQELQKTYKECDAFKIMIDHCEMALAKSNMHAASLYKGLLESGTTEEVLFNQIMDEHLQTATIVNKIKGNDRLLDKNKTIQARIDERNSYTHILNYIQVKLLKDFFSQLKTDPEASSSNTQETLKLLILSMKGIAAALQETG